MSKPNDILSSNEDTSVKAKKEKRIKEYHLNVSQHLLNGVLFFLCLFLFNFVVVKIIALTSMPNAPLVVADSLFLILFHFATKNLQSEAVSDMSVSSVSDSFQNSFEVEEVVDNQFEEELPVVWTTDDVFRVFFIFPLVLSVLVFIVFMISFGMIDNVVASETFLVQAVKNNFFCLILIFGCLRIVPSLLNRLESVTKES